MATTSRAIRRQAARGKAQSTSSTPAWVFVASAAVVTVILLAAVGFALARDHHSTPTASSQASSTPSSNDSPVPDPTPTTAAGQYRASALAQFKSMNSVLLRLVQTALKWQQHKTTDAAVRQEIVKDLPAVEGTKTALSRLAAFSEAPHALTDYQESVALYLESFRILDAAATVRDPATRAQLSLAQQRVRLLGDRVFDQATYALQNVDGGFKEVEGTVVQRLAEVPDWSSIKLAAGPPFRATTPPTAPLREYQQSRPSEPLASWQAAVSGLRIPSGQSEASVVARGTAVQQGELSNTLEGASNDIWAMPDPAALHAESVRVQLSLLVHAESLRAAQAAHLTTGSTGAALGAVAKNLAALGDLLWSSDLPPRTTGFRPNA